MHTHAPAWIRPLFTAAGLYDLVLGAGMFLFFREFYARSGIAPPNHDAYIQFPALVVMIFGIGFLMVAAHPARRRDLIHLGILFKLAYAGTVLWHAVYGSMPTVWTVFAVCDLVFALLFLVALRRLPRSAHAHA